MPMYCPDCDAPYGSPHHDFNCVWPAEDALGITGLNDDDDPAYIMGA